MPSCYGIACLAKRHSSGSGSLITKHKNKSFSPARFWKLPHCTYLILDRFRGGGRLITQKERQVDCFVLFFCTFPWFPSVYNLSDSASKNAELTSSAPLIGICNALGNLFFFFSFVPLSCWSPWPLTLPWYARSPRTLTTAGFLELLRWLTWCKLCQHHKINPWIVPQILQIQTRHYTQGKIVEDNEGVKPQCTTVYTSPHPKGKHFWVLSTAKNIKSIQFFNLIFLKLWKPANSIKIFQPVSHRNQLISRLFLEISVLETGKNKGCWLLH